MAAPVPASHDADPYADRRVYARVPVAILSPGGAKLDCPASLATGTAVILDCGTLGRSAVVRWQNAGVMGVCFDSELDPREAAALIQRSEAMAARIKTRE